MDQVTVAKVGLPTRGNGRIAPGRLAWMTGLAVIIAVAGCAVVYLVASGFGIVHHGIALPSLLGMGSLSLGSVSATAAVATVGAAITFGILSLSTRRPIRNFRVMATVLALLSLSLPATIAGPPAALRMARAAMHVVVWAVSIGVLTTLVAGPRAGQDG